MYLRYLLSCFFSIASCLLGHAQETSVTPAQFEKKLNSTSNIQLLDVRTPTEYKSGHLKEALQADWLNKEQFADRVQYLDRSKPVMVYCASGVRSAQAAKWLQEQGFVDVQNLKGGLISWKLEGKPLAVEENVAQMTMEKYAQSIKSAETVLVDFGAVWCPPCQQMEPILKQLQQELGNKIVLFRVDGGNDTNLMKAMQVNMLPTFILYKKGVEVWRKEGVVALDTLRAKLSHK